MATYHGRGSGGPFYDDKGEDRAVYDRAAYDRDTHDFVDDDGAPQMQGQDAPPTARQRIAEPVSRWVQLAGAATSVALLIGVVVWGYKLAVRDVSGVPIIRAMEGPARIASEDPGGDLARHVGLSVNEVAGKGLAAPGPDRVILAPPPETLSPNDAPMTGVRALVKVDRAQPDELPEAEPASAPAALVPLGDALAIETDVEPIDSPEGQEGATAAQIQSAAAEAAKIRPVARTVPVIRDDTNDRSIVSEDALSPDLPGVAASPRPTSRPTGLRTAEARTPPQDTKPTAAATPSKDSPVKNADIDVTTLPAETRVAQIGAFPTQDLARSEWDRVQAKAADLFAGKKRLIQDAKSNGKTFYRLRVAGFDSAEDANAFCDNLKKRGIVCIPTVVR